LLDKILKYLPLYNLIYAVKYFVAAIQIPHSFLRTLFIKPEITKFNDYTKRNSFIYIYASAEPELGESSFNILKTVKELGGYIILVTNAKSYTFNDQARSLVDVFIDNNDTGWDFAEYKQASKYIYSNLSANDFSKVIYANDSVFYLPKKLKDEVLLLLDDKRDVVSFFDGSANQHYHLASWCLSISKNIFLDPVIRNFWNRYFEVKNKFYTIVRGEFGLSKALFSLSPNVFAVYNGFYLNSLAELNVNNIKYVSAKLTADFFENRYFFYENNNQGADSFKDYVAHNLSSYPVPQTFAPLLLKFYDLSFIKKDLFWHESQSLNSLYFMFSILDEKINESYSNLIKSYFLKRGRISTAKFHVKIMVFLGIR